MCWNSRKKYLEPTCYDRNMNDYENLLVMTHNQKNVKQPYTHGHLLMFTI